MLDWPIRDSQVPPRQEDVLSALDEYAAAKGRGNWEMYTTEFEIHGDANQVDYSLVNILYTLGFRTQDRGITVPFNLFVLIILRAKLRFNGLNKDHVRKRLRELKRKLAGETGEPEPQKKIPMRKDVREALRRREWNVAAAKAALQEAYEQELAYRTNEQLGGDPAPWYHNLEDAWPLYLSILPAEEVPEYAEIMRLETSAER